MRPAIGSESHWKSLSRLARAPIFHGTADRVIRSSSDAIRARADLVRSAGRSVLCLGYYAKPDADGLGFLDALITKAKEGIPVVLGLDSVAQRVADGDRGKDALASMYDRLDELRRVGGIVAWHGGVAAHLDHPFGGVHVKCLAVDGEQAIIDGRNLGDAQWTDFGALVSGPLATRAHAETSRLLRLYRPFRSRWRASEARSTTAAFRSVLDAADRRAAAIRSVGSTPAHRVGRPEKGHRYLLVSGGPLTPDQRADGQNPITLALAESFHRASHSITLSSNFVHGAPVVRRALLAAARRGVRVRVITTGRGAMPLAHLPHAVASAHYRELAAAGAEIYETIDTMEHGKMFVIDNAVAVFGSYNLSLWSDGHNQDFAVFTDDPKVVEAEVAALDGTMTNRCRRVYGDTYSSYLDLLAGPVIRAVT